MHYGSITGGDTGKFRGVYGNLKRNNPDFQEIFEEGVKRGQFIGKMEAKKELRIKFKLDEGAYAPEKAHEWDAGFDLRTPKVVTVAADGWAEVDTGIHVAIPKGYVGFLKSKSGLLMRNGIRTGEGVIDAGYTGSIVVKVYCKDHFGYTFAKGDKLTQLVILPIPEVEMVHVEEIDGGERGDNGFGSTGK